MADSVRKLPHMLRTLRTRLPDTRGLLRQPTVQIARLYASAECLGHAACDRTVPAAVTGLGDPWMYSILTSQLRSGCHRFTSTEHNGDGPFKCYVMQWGVSDFPEKTVTRMYGSTLFVLRGGGWIRISRKKRYVTLE